MQNDLQGLQQAVIDFRDERDWSQFHSPKDTAISLVLESTEFLELFQWKNAEEVTKLLRSDKEDLCDELADVFYWVLLIAHDLNIDLGEALQNKLKKNASKYPIDKSKGKHTKYTQL